MRLGAILDARCPACDKGKITQGLWGIRPKCAECGYNFYPEPGFYLGAMMVGFLVAAVLTVPPLIILKIMEADIALLVAWPFIQYIFVGSFILYYSRIIWLHLEHAMTRTLEDSDRKR